LPDAGRGDLAPHTEIVEMKTPHYILTRRPAAGGKRRYAVTTAAPVTRKTIGWTDRGPSDQTWQLDLWRRIADRGYLAIIKGDGQWTNRGDHGTYIGVGETAELAAQAAWDSRSDEIDEIDESEAIPRALQAAARDLDAADRPASVE